jgi:hypothetical protein
MGMFAAILASSMAGRFNSRGVSEISLLLPGILGGGLMAFLPDADKFRAGKLVGIYLTAVFGPSKSWNILTE